MKNQDTNITLQIEESDVLEILDRPLDQATIHSAEVGQKFLIVNHDDDGANVALVKIKLKKRLQEMDFEKYLEFFQSNQIKVIATNPNFLIVEHDEGYYKVKKIKEINESNMILKLGYTVEQANVIAGGNNFVIVKDPKFDVLFKVMLMSEENNKKKRPLSQVLTKGKRQQQLENSRKVAKSQKKANSQNQLSKLTKEKQNGHQNGDQMKGIYSNQYQYQYQQLFQQSQDVNISYTSFKDIPQNLKGKDFYLISYDTFEEKFHCYPFFNFSGNINNPRIPIMEGIEFFPESPTHLHFCVTKNRLFYLRVTTRKTHPLLDILLKNIPYSESDGTTFTISFENIKFKSIFGLSDNRHAKKFLNFLSDFFEGNLVKTIKVQSNSYFEEEAKKLDQSKRKFLRLQEDLRNASNNESNSIKVQKPKNNPQSPSRDRP